MNNQEYLNPFDQFDQPESEAASEAPVASPTFELDLDPTISRTQVQRHIDRGAETEKAAAQSNLGLLGEAGLFDPAKKTEWAREEKAAAESSRGFWESARDGIIKYRRDALRKIAERSGNPEDGQDPVQDFLESRINGAIEQANMRRAFAEEMERNERAGPQFTTSRALFQDFARGASADVMANLLKGAGYGSGMVAKGIVKGVDAVTGGAKADNMKAEDNVFYRLGELVEAKAEELFPADEARQFEFKTKLASGAGSMAGFYGPAVAYNLLAKAPIPATYIAAGYTPEQAAAMAASASTRASVALTAGTGGLSQAGGEVAEINEAMKKDPSISENDKFWGWMASLPIGASEALPLGSWLSGPDSHWIKSILAEAFEEGGQEFAQTVADNMLDQKIYDPNRRWDEGAWEGLAVGAVLGAKMDAGRKLYTASKTKWQEAKLRRGPGGQPTATDAEPIAEGPADSPASETAPEMPASAPPAAGAVPGYEPTKEPKKPATRRSAWPEDEDFDLSAVPGMVDPEQQSEDGPAELDPDLADFDTLIGRTVPSAEEAGAASYVDRLSAALSDDSDSEAVSPRTDDELSPLDEQYRETFGGSPPAEMSDAAKQRWLDNRSDESPNAPTQDGTLRSRAAPNPAVEAYRSRVESNLAELEKRYGDKMTPDQRQSQAEWAARTQRVGELMATGLRIDEASETAQREADEATAAAPNQDQRVPMQAPDRVSAAQSTGQTTGQSEQSGSSQAVEPAQQSAAKQPAIDAATPSPEMKAAFRDVLRGDKPSKAWAKAVGATPDQMKALLKDAKRQKLIRKGAGGTIRRTALAKQAAPEPKLADQAPTKGKKQTPQSANPVDIAGSPENMAAREAAAREFMRSPEWLGGSIQGGVDTKQQPGYMTPEWKQARVYNVVDDDGKPTGDTIAGFEAAVAHLAAKLEAKIEGGLKFGKIAQLVIGFPGAGKGTVSTEISKKIGAVHITCDDAKMLIPEYEDGYNSGGVHEESTEIAAEVVQSFIERGANIIFEKVGSNSVSVAGPLAGFKRQGYTTGVVYVDVPRAVAMERAISRFKRMNRAPPLSYYDALNVGDVYNILKTTGAANETSKVDWVERGSKGWQTVEAGDTLVGLEVPNRAPRQPGQSQADATLGQPGVGGQDGDGRSNENVRSDRRSESLTIPPELRVDRAIRAREDITGKQLPDFIRAFAERIELARGTKRFNPIFAEIKKDKRITKALALDLAHVVGISPKSNTTKAQAIESIKARHKDFENAQRAILEQGTGDVSTAGIPGGSEILGEDWVSGSTPESDRTGSGRDVGRSVGPDAGSTDNADGLSGTGESARGDTGNSTRDRQSRTDLGAARESRRKALEESIAADREAEREKRETRARSNYEITPDDKIGQGGAKAKVKGNLEALRTLAKIEAEGRTATAEEKQILVKYVGWGAFSQDLFSDYKPEWAKERAALADLLTPDEYRAARGSTLNAHYTSQDVINGMWGALSHLGFAGGRALEPAAGIGHFIGLTPQNLKASTDWSAVELDTVSGRITKALYGAADVRVQGFETVDWPEGFFDLAISNVPFGGYKLEDGQRKGFLIHDYFFVKALDKVRPGGVVAFITSAGTLDKSSSRARRAMSRQATFLGAIRLPGGSKGAFKANAGTDVTTDIIFLRKRVPGEPIGDQTWLDVKEIKTPEGPTEINAYFAENPDMMLGKMRLVGSRYASGTPELIGSSENLEQKIIEAAKAGMPADAFLARGTSAADVAQDIDTETLGKPGALYQKNGKTYRIERGVGVAQKVNAADAKKIGQFIDLRDTVNELLAGQAVGREGFDSAPLREKLNKLYDAFVIEHGPINKTVVTTQVRKSKDLLEPDKEVTIRRYPNFSVFEADPDAQKVAAVENYDAKTGNASKTAIFSQDILAPYERPTITGTGDALAVSLNEFGKIDIPFIADQLGMTEAQAIEALGDKVYLDPKGDTWVAAEQYLAGDVVQRLEDARAAAATDAKYERNVTALEKAQPEQLTRADIRINMGAPWIPLDVYQEFITEQLGVRNVDIRLNEATKKWQIVNKPYFPPSAQAKFGTERVDVSRVLEAAMNSTQIMVYDKDANGDPIRNPAAEQEALARITAMRDMFNGNPRQGVDSWVWADDARATRLEPLYNYAFNRLAPEKYDGSHLTFPGLARVVTFPDGTTGTINLPPHRTSAVWRIIRQGNALLGHVVGSGKAQPLDAKVLTPDGWARMGDISVGDMVIGRDGKPTRVVGVFPQGEKDIYRVTFSDGSATECCDEHLWLTQTYAERNSAVSARRLGKTWECAKPKVRALSDIRATLVAPHLGAKNHSIPIVDSVQFNARPVPLDPYLVGVMIGDGCLRGKATSFASADKEIVDRVAAIVGALNCEVRYRSQHDYDICYLGTMQYAKRDQAMGSGFRGVGFQAVPSHPIRKALSTLGLVGKYSYEKRVPTDYLHNTEEVRLSILRGLMDTDGTVDANGTGVSFGTSSPGLADDVTELVRSLGGIVGRSLKRIAGARNCHLLSICLPPNINPFTLARKASRVKPKSKYVAARYIVGADLVGRKPAQCIAVENPEHLYVTDDFIVTHNTWTMIMSGMEQKRLGLIQRPAYVVPNHMLEQFSNEFLQAYPNAKLLIASKDEMSAKNRKEFVARAAADKWDGVIITHDAFGRIPMSEQAYKDFYEEQIVELEEVMREQAANSGKGSPNVKDSERRKKSLEARLKKLLNKERKDDGATFEEMGVDFLYVDESHLFKNLSFSTQHTRVKGISNSSESQRATDLFVKIRHLERSRPGRSAVFASGTPVSNTMAELYTMQRYLQNDELKKYGIDQFDAWANTFGQMFQEIERTVSGKFKSVTSFSRFINIPELMSIFSRVADVQTADMLNLPRPKLQGGQVGVVEAEASQTELEYMQDLVKRSENLPKDPTIDNMLKIVSEGRKVATDMRLIDQAAPFNPNGKIGKAVTKIYDIWKDGADPALVQMVFLDMGVPGSKGGTKPAKAPKSGDTVSTIDAIRREMTAEATGEDTDTEGEADTESDIMFAGLFNLYEEIRTRLVLKGIPKEQIAFIHEAKGDDGKERMFEDVRNGKIRVFLGSTGKMGVGTNVQKRLIAMHHIDAPWKPAEVEQRDGRILRQGNKNDEIQIYRYVTKNSFDSYMWQILERKAKFIGQLLAGSRGVRDMEDIDNPLPEAAALKAAASGDPRVLDHATLSKEINDLEVARRAHMRASQTARASIGVTERQIKDLSEYLEQYTADAAKVQDISGENFAVTLTTGQKPAAFKDRKKAGEAIRDYIVRVSAGLWGGSTRDIELGQMSGFEMSAKARRTDVGYEITPVLTGQSDYRSTDSTLISPDTNPVGLVLRFERILKQVNGLRAATEIALSKAQADLPRLQAAAQEQRFPKQSELEAKIARRTELEIEINAPADADVVLPSEGEREIPEGKISPADFAKSVSDLKARLGVETVQQADEDEGADVFASLVSFSSQIKKQIKSTQKGSKIALVRQTLGALQKDTADIVTVAKTSANVDIEGAALPELRTFMRALDDLSQILNKKIDAGYKVQDAVEGFSESIGRNLEAFSGNFEEVIEAVKDVNQLAEDATSALVEAFPDAFPEYAEDYEGGDDDLNTGTMLATIEASDPFPASYPENYSIIDMLTEELGISKDIIQQVEKAVTDIAESIDIDAITPEQARAFEQQITAIMQPVDRVSWAARFWRDESLGVVDAAVAMVDKMLDDMVRPTIAQLEETSESVTEKLDEIAALVDEQGDSADTMAAITAYHGSPYDYESFDSSKAGTGEGGAAYGPGIYLADSQLVAAEYKTGLGKKQFPKDGGNVYQVEIDAEPGQFLYWDWPLGEQGAIGAKVIDMIVASTGMSRDKAALIKKDQILGFLGQGEPGFFKDAAVKKLRAAGVPGIAYLDLFSRRSGTGTFNYVIYDQNLLKITHKNGQAVTAQERENVLASLIGGDEVAARKQRAQEQGFDTSKVWYHGATRWEGPGKDGRPVGDFTAFDRLASVNAIGRKVSMDTVGSWFSDLPGKNGASMYAGNSGAVYPVYLKVNNPWQPASFDEFLDKFHEAAKRDPKKQNPRGLGSAEELRSWLKKNGYDGIQFPAGTVDGNDQAVMVALEPTQVRSVNAEFDPAQTDSANISAKLGPYTPRFQSMLPDVVSAIEAEIRQALPPDIAVRMADKVLFAGQEAAGKADLQKRLLEVSLKYGEGVARETGRHETIHILREYKGLGGLRGLYTDEEWSTLLKRAVKVKSGSNIRVAMPDGSAAAGLPFYEKAYRERLARSGLKGEELESRLREMMDQELVAKMAETWIDGARYGTTIDKLLYRITELLDAIARALRSLNFNVPADIFGTESDDVLRRSFSGDIASRSQSAKDQEQARRERAEDIGFDFDTPYYHGTGAIFDAFSREFLGKNFDFGGTGQGFFFTTKKAMAQQYVQKGGRLIDARLKFSNPLKVDINAALANEVDNLLTNGQKLEAFARKLVFKFADKFALFEPEFDRIGNYAWANGYDAVVIDFGPKSRMGKMVIVPEPSQIRDNTAEFDPAEAENANIFASMRGGEAPYKTLVYRGVGKGQWVEPRKDRPLWATPNREVANTYADAEFYGGDSPAVVPMETNFKNPLKVDAAGAHWARIPYQGQTFTSDDLAEFAAKQGHDGLVIENLNDDPSQSGISGDTIAALGPNTMRSATTGEVLYSMIGAGDQPLPGPVMSGLSDLASKIDTGQKPSGDRNNTKPGPVEALSKIIADLKTALRMPSSQGRYGLTVFDGTSGPENNRPPRRWNFRPQENLRGQYHRRTGAARYKLSTDIEAVAHEGGHHLESLFGQPFEQLKRQHADELRSYAYRSFTPAAPDRPAPTLQPGPGYSDVELDSDAQRLLVEAVAADQQWVASGAGRGQNAARAQASVTRAKSELAYRLGQSLADTVFMDVYRHVQAQRGTDNLVQYVQDRFSVNGKPRPPEVDTRATISEGFSEFFREYILNPKQAQTFAPEFAEAFENFLDANGPDLLQNIERAQLITTSKAYDDYLSATTLDRARADLVSDADNRMLANNEVLKAIGQSETISGAASRIYSMATDASTDTASQAYTRLVDEQHPWYLATKSLLETSDQNKRTDASGRAVSLAVHENPYKLIRSIGDSFKTGLRWIQDGVPNYRQLGGQRSASLHDALALAMGKSWNYEAYQDFGVYLESRRAVEEWKTWTAKRKTMADLSGKIKVAAAQNTVLREELAKNEAKVARRSRSEAGNTAIMREYDREIQSLITREANEVRNLQEGLVATPGMTPQQERNARIRLADIRQKLIAYEERRQDFVVRRNTISGESQLYQARADQLTSAINKREAVIDRSRAQLKDMRENGIQRDPHRVNQKEHEQRIAELEKANPNLKQAATLVYDFVWQSAIHDFQAGRLTKAELDYRETRRGFYVPFARDMSDMIQKRGFGGRSMTTAKFSKDKAFEGSDRAIRNPIETIIDQTFHRAAATHFNDVMKSFVALADQVGPGGAAIAERVTQSQILDADSDGFKQIVSRLIAMGYDPEDAKEMVKRIESDFGDTQLLLQWSPEKSADKPLLLPLWENGERKLIRLSDPEWANLVYNSVNGIGRELADIFTNILSKPATLLRIGITTSPAFVIPNIMRDMWSAWILTGNVLDPRTWPVVTQVRGIAHELVQSDMARAYQEVAGIMGGQNVAALSRVRDKADVMALKTKGLHIHPMRLGIASAVGAAAGFAVAGPAGGGFGALIGSGLHRGPKQFFETLAMFSDMSETATRLGVFTHAYKAALSYNPSLTPYQAAQEAAFVARDLIDFGRRGSNMLVAARLVPFLNANIQGLDKTGRTLLGRSDRGFTIGAEKIAGFGALGAGLGYLAGGAVAGSAGAFAVPAAAVALASRSEVVRRALAPFSKKMSGLPLSVNEEQALAESAKAWTNLLLYTLIGIALVAVHGGGDEEEYKMISDRVKHRAQPVKLGGEWYQIPKAFEWSIPANIIEAGINLQYDNDPRFWQRVRDSLAENLSPPMLPQTAKLWGDIRANYNSLSGRQIVPEYQKSLPPQEQFNAYTSQMAIAISRAVNETPWAKATVEGLGRAAFASPNFELSPALIDYALTTGGGYWGKDAQKTSNLGSDLGPKSGDIKEYPIIGTVLQRISVDPYRASDALQAFYKLMSPVTQGYPRSAAGYDTVLKNRGQAAANAVLATMDEDHRAYALLMASSDTAARRTHPLNRLQDIMEAIRSVEQDVLMERLGDTSVKSDPQRIELSPAQAGEIRNTLAKIKAIEANNTMVAIGHEQFAARNKIDLAETMALLHASSSATAEELQRRFERKKIVDYNESVERWPEIKKDLLDTWTELAPTNEEMPNPKKRRNPVLPGMMRLGGPVPPDMRPKWEDGSGEPIKPPAPVNPIPGKFTPNTGDESIIYDTEGDRPETKADEFIPREGEEGIQWDADQNMREIPPSELNKKDPWTGNLL